MVDHEVFADRAFGQASSRVRRRCFVLDGRIMQCFLPEIESAHSDRKGRERTTKRVRSAKGFQNCACAWSFASPPVSREILWTSSFSKRRHWWCTSFSFESGAPRRMLLRIAASSPSAAITISLSVWADAIQTRTSSINVCRAARRSAPVTYMSAASVTDVASESAACSATLTSRDRA